MRFTRVQLLVGGLILLGILGLLALGIAQYLTPKEETTEPTGSSEFITNPEQATYDQVNEALVPGGEVLFANAYTDVQFGFINQSIHAFASANFPYAQGVHIDKTTFIQQGPASNGFTVRDSSDNKLFYVIVTKLSNGEVKVDCYL